MARWFMDSSAEPNRFSWFDLARAISYFLGRQRRRYAAWVALIFLVYFHFLVPPYLIGKIVDFFTTIRPGDSLYDFYFYAVLMGVLAGAASILRLTSKQVLGGIGIHCDYQARVQGFERLMDFSLAWHDRENTGNKVQKIQAGARAISDLMSLLYSSLLPILAQFVGVLSVFLVLKLSFLLFCLAYLSLFALLHLFFYGRLQRAYLEHNRAQESASGTYYESTGNVLTIKALGAKESVKLKVYDKEANTRVQRLKLRDLGIAQWKAFQVVNASSLCLFSVMVGHAVLAKEITVGAIFTYYMYFGKLTESAGEFTDIFHRLVELKALIARMMPYFWEESQTRGGTADFPRDWKELRIVDGGFSYKQGEEEFRVHDLNLRVRRSQKIGIAGRSGSGKSTLAKLLLGVYDLERGHMTIDGREVREIRHAALTEHVSIVLQESELFNLTLEENITLMREIDPELLRRAIEIAQLPDVIAKLPEGLPSFRGRAAAGRDRARDLPRPRNFGAGRGDLIAGQPDRESDSWRDGRGA
jgi:ABC-type multidrug transport system fused ATPase/permease subunit